MRPCQRGHTPVDTCSERSAATAALLCPSLASWMPPRGLLPLILGSKLGVWNLSAPRGAGRRRRTAAGPARSDETRSLRGAVSALSFPPCGSAHSLPSPETPRGRRCRHLHVREEQTGCEAEQETAAGPKGSSLSPDLAGLAPGSLSRPHVRTTWGLKTPGSLVNPLTPSGQAWVLESS